MINKRLISEVSESKKYIAFNVIFQWIGLIANIITIFTFTMFLQSLYLKEVDAKKIATTFLIIATAIVVRFICTTVSSKMSFCSSKNAKIKLREKIYSKLLRLGPSYKNDLSTAQIVQVSVEGVSQLEIYFGSYLPQFFYSMLAPITLFAVISFIDIFAAVMLLICVPLIPISIMAVQTFAKKLLAKYWGQYTTLGDTFLENLQGLTTLKIYQSDQYKNEEMNKESEKFRKITMRVLTMQLNSIIVMDIIAFGGAALGIIISATQFNNGNISLAGCLAIILLSAEFFIPMRILGSYFHIAMNGMAASEKIFSLLDLDEKEVLANESVSNDKSIKICDVNFSYDNEREILSNINMSFKNNGFSAIVGESGCGKSTIASILIGRNRGYNGKIIIGDSDLTKISDTTLMNNITYVGFDSYLFKGTVRENLKIANEKATDEMLWSVLERVNLSQFLKSENGLDTKLTEKASNLSGGQRQRLALARAILHDTPIYIFDEATSNIDVESENEILKEVYELSKTKTVIFITHRLANVRTAQTIYVLENGKVCDSGKHDELVLKNGVYNNLWQTQFELENYKKEAVQ